MDYLWTPWRYNYVSTAEHAERQGVPDKLSAWPGDHNCVFCNMIAALDHAVASGMNVEDADRAVGVVYRGTKCFICLNAFPYATGHVMVLPYEHQPSLAALDRDAAHEMMDLSQQTERVLEKLYAPHGMNFGLNLGRAAGAGVAGHLHLHAVPRWAGDTNYMTVIGETRVLPEGLTTTWERVRKGFVSS